MDFNTARRRKWTIKVIMSKGLESHHVITLQTLSKHVKARRKELEGGKKLRKPLTPLLPWVVEVAFRDFTNAFGKLGVDLIRMDIKERH